MFGWVRVLDARVCVCILSLTQWESRWSKLRGAGTRSRRSRRMGMGRGGKGKGIEGAKGSSSGLGISRPQYTHSLNLSLSHSLSPPNLNPNFYSPPVSFSSFFSFLSYFLISLYCALGYIPSKAI